MKRRELFTAAAVLTIAAAMTGFQTTKAEAGENMITGVTVNTEVTPGGQFPKNIELTVSDPAAASDLTADDFLFEGNAGGWMAQQTHPFTAEFADMSVDGDVVRLGFGTFPEKYFYVEDFKVTCVKDATMSFTNEQVDHVVTPVADEFEKMTYAGDPNNSYWLFTPEKTDEPMPVVVVFHGFSDTNNLLCYRTSVDWAEEENQKVRPCYVMSPTIRDEDYYMEPGRNHIYEMVKDTLQTMIDEGKADPSRIYVMGNSFGGMATLEFIEKYPEIPAGAIALCSALTYSQNALKNVINITDTPIWLAQATHDQTIPVSCSQDAYELLQKAGNKNAHYTEYDDEAMNAAGGIDDPNSTYSYHHVELAVMADEAYKVWLFEQRLGS